MNLLLNHIKFYMYNGSHYTKMQQSPSEFLSNVNNNDDNCVCCMLQISRGTKRTYMCWWVTVTIKHCSSSVKVRRFVSCNTQEYTLTHSTQGGWVCCLNSDGRATKWSTSRKRPYVVSLAFIYILFVSLCGYSWTLPTRFTFTMVLNEIHNQKHQVEKMAAI